MRVGRLKPRKMLFVFVCGGGGGVCSPFLFLRQCEAPVLFKKRHSLELRPAEEKNYKALTTVCRRQTGERLAAAAAAAAEIHISRLEKLTRPIKRAPGCQLQGRCRSSKDLLTGDSEQRTVNTARHLLHVPCFAGSSLLPPCRHVPDNRHSCSCSKEPRNVCPNH